MQNFLPQNSENASRNTFPRQSLKSLVEAGKEEMAEFCADCHQPIVLTDKTKYINMCDACTFNKCDICIRDIDNPQARPEHLQEYEDVCYSCADRMWWDTIGIGQAYDRLNKAKANQLKRHPTRRIEPISDDDEDIKTRNKAIFDNIAITAPNRVIVFDQDYEHFEGADRFEISSLDFETTPTKRKATKQLSDSDLFSSDDDTTVVTSQPSTVNARNQKSGNECVRWCITYNNPSCTFAEWCDIFTTSGDWKFFIGQEETGANGTPHFQCYAELVRKRRTQQVHALLSPHKVALLYAKGNRATNVAYCSKEDTRTGAQYQWFDEQRTKGRGGLKELDIVAQKVLEEGVSADLIEDHKALWIRHGKGIQAMAHSHKLLKAAAAKKAYWKEQYERQLAGLPIEGQQQRECYLFFGPTGCGKTTKVELTINGELDLSMYKKDGKTKWFDEYKNQEAIFIDEFNGSAMSIETINDLTNKDDTYQAEFKGGSVTIVATHLFFASNRHPSDWWKVGENDSLHWPEPRYQALARRFKKVYWWDDEKHLTVLENPNLFSALDATDLETKTKAWTDFWRWKHAPVSEGYSIVTGDEKYFTLYN